MLPKHTKHTHKNINVQ